MTKFRIDHRSLKFRLGMYFFLFTGILLLLIWLLQIFFLNHYYKEMKIRETTTTATRINELYKNNDITKIRKQISDIYDRSDMYIEIETKDGIPIFIPYIDIEDSGSTSGDDSSAKKTEETAANMKETTNKDETATPHLPPSVYKARISDLKKTLEESKSNMTSKQVTDPDTGLITLEYASYLSPNEDGSKDILYIFSPLYPIGSTVEILSSQLFYIIVITLILAFLVSLYLSNRITTPLSRITESAKRLGKGEYGIMFEGAHYSEIIELADTLTYTSMELAKTDTMQKDVIANVSHDLRTPLTMVISYAEMVRDLSGNDPDKRTEHLQVIIDEAERLNHLVTELLEVSRMQSGDARIDRTEFSLKDSISTLLQSYAGFVEQEGYKLIFISRGSGMVTADETRIKQVIANLVSNAFKYCGLDRTVEVRMFDEEDHVRCEVSDHGIGIPKRDLRHIWERYYKASTNYQRSTSSGLGLSIVKEILLMHGANFGVESALRKGSTFWFEIKKPDPSEDEQTAALPRKGTLIEMDEMPPEDEVTIAGSSVSHSITPADEDDSDMIIIEDNMARKRAVGIRTDKEG